jgi:hypothetical protein
MRRKSGFALRKAGEVNIVVPLGQKVLDLNGVITLNETGAFIWELLGEERSLDELVEAVSQEFDVEPDQARKDIEDFLEDLRKFDMLEG